MFETTMRTHSCGELGAAQEGSEVRLCGWVAKFRDHGGVVFLDLRDRFGVTQVVVRPDAPDAMKALEAVKPECAVQCEGVVQLRPEGLANPAMTTGAVEVSARAIRILGPADPTPFVIGDEEVPAPDLRMKYRYLDLRRPGILERLLLRHRVAGACRRALDARGFVEVETPMLTRSTPEGARDYVVPSRVAKGAFYALPQSPQLFKQLLMVAGADRYYQIVKCFRDEDLRSDRQPEFTQLDIEMAFAGEEDILAVSEEILRSSLAAAGADPLPGPLPRIPYDEALLRYGSDKPDLRFGLEIRPLPEGGRGCGFRVFEEAAGRGDAVRGIRVPGGAALSRKKVEGIEDAGKAEGLKGLVPLKVEGGALQGSAAKRLKEGVGPSWIAAFEAGDGDLILLAAGPGDALSKGLGAVRLALARELDLARAGFAALWLVDPPLFTPDAETGRPDPSHHPFTMPRESDLDALETAPFAARARAYDLVLNGHEIAGGSVRIHRRDVQNRVFALLGIGEEEAREKFGFLLEAFRYGAPPHAGIAFGFDRFVMLLAGLDQIREVIAFPKTTSAACLLTGAPAALDERQLQALGIGLQARH